MRLVRAIPALVLAVAAAGPAVAAGTPPYRLAGIRAQLVFETTGALSRPIPPGAPLFNTVIGEGWAGQPADDVLVGVAVRGRPGSFVARRRVVLEIRRGRRDSAGVLRFGPPTARRHDLPVLDGPGGSAVVPFFLSAITCTPVRLSARITGQRPSPVATRTLDFTCGE